MRIKKAIILLILIMPLFVVKYAFSSLNIPIIVQEALPAGVSGIDRDNEPLTVGIPLMDSDNIKDISQLGLSGVSIGQFRVLRRYPSGNIQWVLIDTQVSLPANGKTTIYLTNGTGNFGGPNLAEDKGDYIVVNTGPAQFVIRKKNFNFIDSVVVDGEEFVHSGNSGSIVALSDNIYYKSINDQNSTAIIEENGPVRAVVKADGKLLDENGNFLFGYTVRFHFFKNKRYVKCVVTIKNAYYDSVNIKPFQGIWIEVPTILKEPLYFRFVRNGEEVSGLIDQVAYIYQANTLQKVSLNEINYFKKHLCSSVGLEIKNGDKVLQSLGDISDSSQGLAEIYGLDGQGITFGIRNFDAFFPDSYTLFSDGKIRLDIFSPYNSFVPNFAWGVHETRHILLDFHLKQANNKLLYYVLQYPLIARAPYEQYVNSGSIYGENRLIDYKQEKDFFDQVSQDYNLDYSFKLTNISEKIWRNMGEGSWGREFDHVLTYILNYLRTGYPGFYLLAFDQNRFKADLSVVHSDDFLWLENAPVKRIDYVANSDYYHCFNAYYFDFEHIQDVSLPIWYYMTGDENIKDAILDLIDYRLKTDWQFKHNLSDTSGMEYMRWWARTYRSCAIYYYFLNGDNYGDFYQNLRDKLLYYLKYMTIQLLRYRDNPDVNDDNYEWRFGWNLDRGYWYDPKTSQTKNHEEEKISSPIPRNVCFMLTSMLMVGAQFAYQVMPDKALREDLENFLLGLGWFDYYEFIPAHQYVYKLDEYNPKGSRQDYSGYSFALLYELVGDDKILDFIRPLLWKQAVYRSYEALSAPFTQCVIYDYFHKNDIHVGYIDPVGNGEVTLRSTHVKKNTDGTYTLTWMVPVDGIIKYQIKISDQPMVENLNFNQWNEPKTINGTLVPPRSFQFDPNKYDNFWAALNIDNEPKPGKKGDLQTITIDIAKVINDYNERYGLKDGDPAYIKYDPNKTYYFAIKYWTKGELPLSISTYSNLPSATLNQDYSIYIKAVGGSGGYKFYLESGDLPLGIYLSQDGYLSGTPSETGNFNFTIKVVDSDGNFYSKEFTLCVKSFVIEDLSIPEAILYKEYNFSFSVSGGTPPYSWFIESGSLPSGLSLSSEGILSGVPKELGSYRFTLKVVDSNHYQIQKEFTLNVIDSNPSSWTSHDNDDTTVVIAGGVQEGESKPKSGCFIATAAYGTPMAKEIKYLCKFRDQYLLPNKYGRKFVMFYYKYSPPIANYIAKHETLRAIVRFFLRPLVWMSKEVTE